MDIRKLKKAAKELNKKLELVPEIKTVIGKTGVTKSYLESKVKEASRLILMPQDGISEETLETLKELGVEIGEGYLEKRTEPQFLKDLDDEKNP